MFVVRRSFRNYGEMLSPGSLVEPGDVKRFRSRLNDGHIVEVSQQDFDKWQKYFSERMGVQISLPEESAQQPEESEQSAQQPEEPEQSAQQPVQVAKVVVKAN